MFTVNEIAVEEDPEDLLAESLQGVFHARHKILHGKPSADHKETAEIVIPTQVGLTGIVEKTKDVVAVQKA